MNYQELLKKYMKLVMDCEYDYLDHNLKRRNFTDEEVEELKRISKEVHKELYES